MRRRLGLLTAATWLAVGGAIAAAAPASASADGVAPPPSSIGENCRVLVGLCHPGLHNG
jgi:hypothetical protein